MSCWDSQFKAVEKSIKSVKWFTIHWNILSRNDQKVSFLIEWRTKLAKLNKLWLAMYLWDTYVHSCNKFNPFFSSLTHIWPIDTVSKPSPPRAQSRFKSCASLTWGSLNYMNLGTCFYVWILHSNDCASKSPAISG